MPYFVQGVPYHVFPPLTGQGVGDDHESSEAHWDSDDSLKNCREGVVGDVTSVFVLENDEFVGVNANAVWIPFIVISTGMYLLIAV